jgi:steroid delta-isomerase-like uncharacterized protein
MTDGATLSRRIIDEVWNQRNVDAADELISSDCVVHDPNSVHKGLDAYKQFVREYLSAFPDLHFTIEDQISDEHGVATRWTCTGTHQGDLQGIPATGRRVTVSGILLSKVKDGKFVESWSSWDTMSLLQQLGVMSSRETVAAA